MGEATETLSYTVMGRPVSWARARRKGGVHFTATKQASAKVAHNLTCAAALGPTGRRMWNREGAFAVDVVGVYPTAVVGDVDRLVSLPLDALEGLLWNVDRQVRQIRAAVVCDGSAPRTIVTIRRLTQDTVATKQGRAATTSRPAATAGADKESGRSRRSASPRGPQRRESL